MGGGGSQRTLITGVLDNGDGQCRTLNGVGACPQLIEENETVVIGLLQNLHNVGHMGRESGQALLNALLIAHIGEDAVKDADLRAAVGGDMEAALRHKAQKTQRFQRHRLTARVRACNDEGIVLAAQFHRDRHSLGAV